MEQKKKIKHIRVFISSTFREMQEERDIIVKKVFPRFRIETENRGISFSYVDLRWGVKPNAMPKEIIDTCLSEIKNCEPYFIGLIGHNYGSIIPDLENAEIDQLEKNHEGVNALIQNGSEKKIGYTELEMRYNLLYSKDKSRNFFYIKDDKTHNRGCLFSLIPQISKWMKRSNKDESLEDLKEFVWSNYHETTSEYTNDTTYQNSEGLEKQVYIDLMSIIQDIPIPNFPQETFVRNNQEFFLEIQKELVPRSLVKEIVNWVSHDDVSNNDCTEILLLKGEYGSGKTSIIAEYLNHRHPDLYVLYHFVGVSLLRETPELILKDLIAQICAYLEIKEPLYSQEETKEDLCQYLTQYLQKSDKKSVIVIDDIEEIDCDTDSLMSIISWLPAKIKNLKYAFSLSKNRILFQHCPDWINKTELALDDLSPSDCYDFSKKYLLQRYRKDISGEYGKDKVELLTPDFFNNKDRFYLRNTSLLKLFVDEIAMLDFGEDEDGNKLVKMIEEKSRDKRVLVSLPLARIEKEIFGEEKTKAVRMLSFLAIADFGLYENDIADICSDSNNQLTQIDWSLLYCHIKPYIITEGYIKLSIDIKEIITSRYLWNKETQNKYREELSKRLELLNDNNQYTIEILNQYLKSKNYVELKRFLSSSLIITYVFKNNKELLFESLKALKAHKLSNDLAGNLMTSVESLDENLQLDSYMTITDIFSKTLPIYDIALTAINRAISIQESNNGKTDEEKRGLANYYLKRTRLLSTLYRFEDAYKSIEEYFQLLSKDNKLSEDVSLRVQGLIVKAEIYKHNPSTLEKLKAIPIYQNAINQIDNNDDMIYMLYCLAKLSGYYLHDDNIVNKCKEEMCSYVSRNMLYGTSSYFKTKLYILDLESMELYLNENDIDRQQNHLLRLTNNLNKYVELYGNKTRDIASYYKLIGDTYCHIAGMYYNENNYVEYVMNVDSAAHYYDLYKETIDAIFQNDTKAYANALYEVARSLQFFLETRPMERDMILNSCLSLYSHVEHILRELFPDGHYDLAYVYNNMALIFKEKAEFDTAKEYIENAIQMKRKFIDINEKSLYYSYISKLIIYKTEIVEKEIHDVELLAKFQERITELLAFTKDDLVLSEQDKDSRIQEIMKYQSWLDNWRNNSQECYYNHAKSLFEIAKKMIRDFQVRMKLYLEKIPHLSVPLYIQWERLNSYIVNHHLQAEFDKNEEYNNFKPLMNLIEELNSKMAIKTGLYSPRTYVHGSDEHLFDN